jgi:carbon monoxide dehydrogenase subunit G
MRLEGTRTFAAPQGAVWRALVDPERLATAIRAIERVDVDGPQRFRATVRIPLGPTDLRLTLQFERV